MPDVTMVRDSRVTAATAGSAEIVPDTGVCERGHRPPVGSAEMARATTGSCQGSSPRLRGHMKKWGMALMGLFRVFAAIGAVFRARSLIAPVK